MSDFIAINPGNKNEGTITNNAFFPDIVLSHVRESQSLDSTVTTERLKQAVLLAISRTNQDLLEWRLEQQACGYHSINQVPGEQVNGENLFIHQYRHAIYCLANAFVIEKYRNFDATAQGIKKTEAIIETANDLYREARYAIRDILGIAYSTFALV